MKAERRYNPLGHLDLDVLDDPDFQEDSVRAGMMGRELDTAEVHLGDAVGLIAEQIHITGVAVKRMNTSVQLGSVQKIS